MYPFTTCVDLRRIVLEEAYAVASSSLYAKCAKERKKFSMVVILVSN